MPGERYDETEYPAGDAGYREEIQAKISRMERNQGLHLKKKQFDGRGGKIPSFDLFFMGLLIIAVLLSGFDLYRRIGIEWSHRIVGMAVEYRDIVLLSHQAGEPADAIFSRMKLCGVEGVMVQELTGKDLSAGFLPISYGSLATFRPMLRFAISLPLDRAAILVENSEPILEPIVDYLRIRMKSIVTLTIAEGTLIVMPAATDELADSGIIPDFSALAFAERVGTVALYRPTPASGVDGERTADSIRWLKSKYPSISCVVPAGQTVSGYPELAPIARTLKELNLPVGQAEFVRQIGISELYSGVKPLLLPMHSLVREELISRRFSREQIIERMVRAVHERSIRIVLFRPYDLYSVGKLAPFLEDMGKIKDALVSRAYRTGWPRPIPAFKASIGASLGLALVFLITLYSYARRYLNGYSSAMSKAELAAIIAGAAVLGLCLWKISAAAKLLGGAVTAILATEAALWALDRYKKPFHGLLAGLGITLGGGLVIAAFYGTSDSMLRLAPFSGVKLTLLLPPVLILAHDLKKRIHPESLIDIINRPPLWGELMLAGLLISAAVILTIRSDNASYVPGWEIRLRDFLERMLWIRPRTKEFLVGYPCLVICFVAEKRGWIPNYREIFRIGASIAFASAVNSFCHFHTILPLTVARVLSGWCLGIAMGFVVLALVEYMGGPIRRGVRELLD
ncbi:MAG: DUF5693 family protein [Synergistaceae bacterium]|jgi:hypothetical protein|nr:DUF5693 family protein [Synergistaceae bacterium]